eukprot:5394423-Pyramimonas_sp.AAC.1
MALSLAMVHVAWYNSAVGRLRRLGHLSGRWPEGGLSRRRALRVRGEQRLALRYCARSEAAVLPHVRELLLPARPRDRELLAELALDADAELYAMTTR